MNSARQTYCDRNHLNEVLLRTMSQFMIQTSFKIKEATTQYCTVILFINDCLSFAPHEESLLRATHSTV